ncbi:hypothetical protein B0J13DRAFT_562167 [Dactylonectria estremocensis]|uniref:Uncharacterized protein n=1 Tax=Dactylonectria estremocensis TaxID=1079267 RepID=A0A9P9IS87_9HYPO|nr:hypothetical protein B0J13DRAFT_562167 [Dactylonectria estremocensis]
MKAFLALFLLHSLPRVSSDDSNPFDGIDPATVRCDAEYLNDAGADADDRWAAAGAQWAFEVTNAQWGWYQGTADADRLGYSEFVGNSFNSKDMLVCSNMGDGPCQSSVTCSEVNQPAGFLILNSFVALHVMHRNIWEALQAAMNEMQNSMSVFSTTFSPAAEPKGKGWLGDLITIVQFAVGIGSAFAWNIAIKEAKLIADAGLHATAQESVNGAIGMAFTIGKNHIPAAKDEIQNDLTVSMGSVFDSWIDAEIDFLNQLFSGTNEALDILEGLVKDGLALELTRHLDLGSFVDMAQKIVYSQLLPIAWKTSSREVEEWPKLMVPMILMEPSDCVTSDLPSYLGEDDVAKTSVCYDRHTFFLGYITWDSEHGEFQTLPGGTTDELDGTKWGGIMIEDLVVSTYEGWRLNGGKMGYEIPENSKIIDGAGTEGGLILENGVRTPGFVKLPICTYAKAKDVATRYWRENLPLTDPQVNGVEWTPCGDGALMEEDLGAWGF